MADRLLGIKPLSVTLSDLLPRGPTWTNRHLNLDTIFFQEYQFENACKPCRWYCIYRINYAGVNSVQREPTQYLCMQFITCLFRTAPPVISHYDYTAHQTITVKYCAYLISLVEWKNPYPILHYLIKWGVNNQVMIFKFVPYTHFHFHNIPQITHANT